MADRARIFDTGWVGADPDDDLDRRLAAEADEEPFDPGRPHVMTVLGPIEPGALGLTLVDERVAATPPASAADPDLRLDDRDAVLAELEDFHAAGGRGIVDGATADWGRDAAALRWIAARAPVHLIAVTGRAGTDAASHIPDDGRSADAMAAAFAREIADGIGDTGVRAGAIVAGLSAGTPAANASVLIRVAAQAHLVTGAPLFLRAASAVDALTGLIIVAEAGVAAGRVVVGGFAVRPDRSSLHRLLEAGVRVAFDRVGDNARWPMAEQAADIHSLVAAGGGDRIVVSAGLTRRSSLRAFGGSPGWVGTLERLPLLLMDAGLDAPAVRRLLIDNPANALQFGTEDG